MSSRGTSMDFGRMQRMGEYYLDLLSNISTVCQKLADCDDAAFQFLFFSILNETPNCRDVD
jgi:hypothetical protein